MRLIQTTGTRVFLGLASIANEIGEETRASSGRAFTPEAGLVDRKETST